MKMIQKTKQSRPKNKRRRFRPVQHILFVFLALILASSGWRLYQLQSDVTKKIAQLNEEKSNLLQEKKALEDEIVQLNTPSYIEQLAREQLGLVRKGEIRIAPKKQ
jgi:cell division protein DivIC